jgi:hypothetical protein
VPNKGNNPVSDPTSIFDSNSSATPTPPAGSNPANVSQPSAVDTMLLSIKNERGEPKYKSLEEALNALKHSQEYIPQLSQKITERERELDEARQAAAKVAQLEDVVRNLTQQSNPNANTTPQGMTAEQVAELVNSTLSRKQQEEIAQRNTSIVAQTVASKFGAEAEQKFYDKAEELGMTKQEFNALASKNPKAVLSLLGITDTAVPTPQGKQSTQVTALNTAGFQPQNETLIGPNKVPTLIGATTKQLNEEAARSRAMVEELHASGKEIKDLVHPSVYFKVFQK